MRRFKMLMPWVALLVLLGVAIWLYPRQWAVWLALATLTAAVSGFWHALRRELSHRGEERPTLREDDSMPQTVVRLLVGLAVLAALAPFVIVILSGTVGLSGVSRLMAERVSLISFIGLLVLMAVVTGAWYTVRFLRRTEAGTGNRHSRRVVVSIVASVIVIGAAIALALQACNG